jgi:hypothetical protein
LIKVILSSKKISPDCLVENKKLLFELLLHLSDPRPFLLALFLLFQLFLGALFDEQLELIIVFLEIRVFTHKETLDPPSAFLELLTVTGQDSDVQILIVKLNHAGLALSSMSSFFLN